MSIINLKDGLPGNWLAFNGQNFPHGFKNTLKKSSGPASSRETLDQFSSLSIKPPIRLPAAKTFTATMPPANPCRAGAGSGSTRPPTAMSRPITSSIAAIAQPAVFEESVHGLPPVGIRYYCSVLDSGPIQDKRMCMDYHDQSMIRGPGIPRRASMTVRRTVKPAHRLLTATGSTIVNVGTIGLYASGMDYGEETPVTTAVSVIPGNLRDQWVLRLQRIAPG